MQQSDSGYRRFFLFTFLWTWGLLIIPIILGLGYEAPLTKILFYLAGIAPSTTGIILAYFTRDKFYWRSFWRRTLNFKQIRLKWYLIIFAVIPVTSLLAVGLNYHFTRELPDFATLHSFLAEPGRLLPFVLYMLAFGPLAEEIGWRGYALDHLERKYNWFISSLVLGFYWSLWHLPMFFIEGTYQNELISRSFFLFVDFNLGIFAMSVIMDWIYNHNGRSILAGILVHFCTNFFGEILDLPDGVMYLRTVIQLILALVILVLWQTRTPSANSSFGS